ncbi:MAG TPA: hypothetical protein VHC04_10685, partial [Rhodopila sp.]|nr:hypothetical protein [Rhodopila sp.]
HGRVVDVSRDRVNDQLPSVSPGKGKQGEDVIDDERSPQDRGYVAHVMLDHSTLTIDGRVEPLSPGMAVTAEIKTGRRSVMSYLLSPLRRYVHDGGKER